MKQMFSVCLHLAIACSGYTLIPTCTEAFQLTGPGEPFDSPEERRARMPDWNTTTLKWGTELVS